MNYCTLALLTLGACVPTADIQITNPLVAKRIEPNKIVKPNGYFESSRGLPAGAMTDEATLLSVDAQQLCAEVSLHESSPIDLRTAEVRLSVPKAEEIRGAQVWATSSQNTYQGLVPEQRRVGTETYCAAKDRYDVCTSWQTRPTYATEMVPGPVTVYGSKGKLCFAHRGTITPATQVVSLVVKVQQAGQTNGWFGPATKDSEFNWGFAGGTAQK